MKTITSNWASGAAVLPLLLLLALSSQSFGQINALNPSFTLQPGMAISPALQAAKIVRLSPGVGRAQILQLRDDQTIEMPSGRQLSVGSYRRLTDAFASAQSRGAARAAAPFAYSKPAGGISLPAGETTAQLLKRPDSTVVRFPNGAVASVAQVKAMKPFVEQRYGVSLDAPAAAPPAGAVLKVANLQSALSELKGKPDSTVLESPKGTRVTVGDLKLALGVPALEAAQSNKARPGSTVAPISPGAKP
jgi:hypothetical protein